MFCGGKSLIVSRVNTKYKLPFIGAAVYSCDTVSLFLMSVSELTDDKNSSASMYQAVAELPKANRDTLAFLMLHLHRQEMMIQQI